MKRFDFHLCAFEKKKSDQLYDTVKPIIMYKVDNIQDFLQLLKNIYLTSGLSGSLKKISNIDPLCDSITTVANVFIWQKFTQNSLSPALCEYLKYCGMYVWKYRKLNIN